MDGYVPERRQDNSSGPTGYQLVGGVAAAAGLSIVAPNQTRAAIRGLGGAAAHAGGTIFNATRGALSYINRSTGAGSTLNEIGTFLGAYNEAANIASRRSIFSAFRPDNNFNARFSDAISTRLAERGRRSEDMLGNTPVRFQERFSEFLTALRNNRSMVMKDLRSGTVASSLAQRFPQHVSEGLHSALTQQEDDFFYRPTLGKVQNFVKRYSDEAERQKAGLAFKLNFADDAAREQFTKAMFDSVDMAAKLKDQHLIRGRVYGPDGKRIPGAKPTFEGEVFAGVDGLRSIQLEALKRQSRVNRETWVNKVMDRAGYEPATIGHLIDHNLLRDGSMPLVRASGKVQDSMIASKIKMMAKFDREFLELAADPFLFIRKGVKPGELKQSDLVDGRRGASGLYNMLSTIRDTTQVPFLRFNPLDLMHWTTIQSVKEAPSFYFFRRGTIEGMLGRGANTLAHPQAHNQDAAVGTLAQDYMYAGNKVYEVRTGKVVKEDVYLTSDRFGMFPRMKASMMNLHRQDYRTRGFFGNLFDIGKQETESVFSRIGSTFTKFQNEDWEPNTLRRLFSEKAFSIDFVEKSYKNLYSFMNQRAAALSDDTVRFLNEHAKTAYGDLGIDLTKLNTAEELMSALSRIDNNINRGAVHTSELTELIQNMTAQYRANRQEFVKNKRILSDNHPYLPGPFQAVDAHETQLISKLDDVRRLIHQHAIAQIDSTGITVGDLIRQGIDNGQLSMKAMDEVRDLKVLTRMHHWWDDVYKKSDYNRTAALGEFVGAIRGVDSKGGEFAVNLADSIQRHSPWYTMGPGQEPPQYFGLKGFGLMNKARGARWAITNYNEAVKQGIDPMKAMLGSAWGVLKQPFAGRNNLDDVTTATAFFYYGAERLDNALAKVGLGLSQKNRGSMQSILINQFMRRIVLPYAAIQQLNYFDDMTGDFFSDKLADTYVNMHRDMAAFKDFLGLNAINRGLGSMLPGADQFWRTPIGGLMKHGSFGLFGDSRSAEELDYYYAHGEDPVRKGRWWGIGSNTPWEGGKIEYYQPNWYRRLKSDYKMTDTLYGSESEYWANNWMPTLTHPFAPIKHFLVDTNHWEEKHREDRPYAVTGGIPELQMVPLVGPILDNTVGRILKPRVEHPELEKAHRQYIEEINNYVRAQQINATQGGVLNLMPAGGYKLFSSNLGSGLGWSDDAFSVGAGGGGSGEIYAEDGTVIGQEVGSGGGAGATAARGMLTGINTGLKGGTSPARPITSLDALRDPDFVADLADINNPYSIGQTLIASRYSLTEMAGIYGFSLNTLLGIKENPGMALDQSSRMSSYSRAWWDMEFGGADFMTGLGMGGEFSEIFRRYNPRDPRKQYYNPIRNTMPDWLPGIEYYIDFQHGDPYVKIPKGEMRLPGEAYETLNRLHPDAFGEYGAFDRFKILADVAPYSDQYKFYRRVVSGMNAEGQLTEEMNREYAEIRDQVTERKKKYHLYPYKFRDADVIKKKVTITHILDANTFLTEEYPNNPIRLAGVRIPSDATEVQQWLSQYIYEGAHVTVGLDADPLFRVRDDTLNTMHAVVYSNGNDSNPFYMSTKGQSVNAMLARASFGGFLGIGGHNPVKITDDRSGVATAALFDSSQITVGKLWEKAVHQVLPNIPILGTIIDKFIQIRSPLEMYKKNEVYGKAWRPWYDPWKGWIQPMFETAAANNPLIAAAQGAGIGWLATNRGGRYWGTRGGAIVFGGLAALRSIDEFIGERMPGGDDYAWIPERRRREREINQYFDILNYMKYRGLYERARQEALDDEGVDLDKILGDSKKRGDSNKKAREYFETAKKWLAINKQLGYVDDSIVEEQLAKARDRLGQIDEDRSSVALGPKAMQAMQYRLAYESTLYGADVNGDMTQIFRALPDKDREFFQYFMTASPQDREEILRLVPEDQKRFYQAKWGMKVDDRPSLAAYFSTHNLPGANWEGWRPDVNLESIKLKVVQNEGLELSDFGLWEDDVKRANQAGAEAINYKRPSMFLDPSRIEKVLSGAGLKDVTVTMSVSPHDGDQNLISMTMNMLRDRSQDIVDGLNENMASLV